MDFLIAPPVIQLSILICSLMVISVRLFQKPRSSESIKTCNYILMGLGGLALLTYIGFNPVKEPHRTDLFHYYVGSKYFPELGYTRLYVCTEIAEAESNQPLVPLITDLSASTTNYLISPIPYLSNPEYCKSHFSAHRWDDFKNDVAFFHELAAEDAVWQKILMDHGYNGSPVWALAGGFISSHVPLSRQSSTGMALIDMVFLFGSAACLVWAFGLPVAAFAIIIGTAASEAEGGWVLGSLLRLDWMFMAILSVCAMKRKYYVLAGAALGSSAALRMFPGVFALGPFVGILYAIYKNNIPLKLAYGKFLGAMMLSVIVLELLAGSVYGWKSLEDFYENTQRHSNSIVSNFVGIRQALTFRPDSSYRSLRHRADLSNGERFAIMRDAKIESRQKMFPIYIALAVILPILFVPAIMSQENAWQSLALGATLIPFLWVDLTSYYYLFLMMVATLFASHWKVAFPLLGIGIVTKIGSITGELMFQDELNLLFSAAVCIGFLIIWRQVNSQSLYCPGLSAIKTRILNAGFRQK